LIIGLFQNARIGCVLVLFPSILLLSFHVVIQFLLALILLHLPLKILKTLAPRLTLRLVRGGLLAVVEILQIAGAKIKPIFIVRPASIAPAAGAVVPRAYLAVGAAQL